MCGNQFLIGKVLEMTHDTNTLIDTYQSCTTLHVSNISCPSYRY